MAEMQFEQSYIDIHVKRKMFLKGLKAMRNNVIVNEKRRRISKVSCDFCLYSNRVLDIEGRVTNA